MKVLSLFVGALLPLTFALPTVQLLKPRQDLNKITDTLLFDDSISQFEAARNKKDPAGLDWTSDGCSDSPEDPLGYDFTKCCHRHDFGYRNYKDQSRFTDSGKSKIDNNFKQDMYDVCGKENIVEKEICEGVADVYFEAVKTFGNKRRAAEYLRERSEQQ